MKKNKFKQDKGTAGLTILLSVIVILFIMGLLIAIFAIMSSELQDSQYTATTASIANETLTTLNQSVGDALTVNSLRHVVCSNVLIYNRTDGERVSTGNYTVANCTIFGITGTGYLSQNVNVSYSYTHDLANDVTDTINDTITGIKEVVDWFDIFIVITAMVVLIALTVIIITALRGSGMMQGGGNSGANQVGTA